MRLIHFYRLFIMLLVLSGTSFAQAREMRALIVGVSEYPSLPKDFQLDGPRNDAIHTRDVLMQRGFPAENIKVLADGVSGAGSPTRKNILAELDRLAKTATGDDFVFLYFAGHGSQQPADRNTDEGRAEPDGLYEIFLPRDIGAWNGSAGGIENALVKTEMRDAFDKILAKGAFVWGIFDSCHSATMVRGGPDANVHYRYVSPQDLGIPQTALDNALQAAPKTRGGPATEAPLVASTVATSANQNTGGSVFFYAAQTRETTPEMLMPQGQADGQYYGLFGFTVMEALETGAPMTYRQMAQYVLTRYGAMNESRVTPLFSGTSLDQPVLFQNTPLVQQWKIEAGHDIVINAGSLARLSEGAIVAVMTDPLAQNDAAVGYLKLTQVSLAASTAVPVAYNGKPALTAADIPARSFARLVQSPPQYTLRVSVDAKDCSKQCAPKAVVDALRKAKTSVSGTVIKWVDAPATGDVMLKLLPDRILLLPPSLQGVNCAKSSGACDQSATLLSSKATGNIDTALHDKLSESLHAISRATNLLRLASGLSTAAVNNSKLDVSIKIVDKNGKAIVFSKDQVPRLQAGDRISVSLKNNGSSSVDVTMLYMDARYGIGVLFPNSPGASNRLEPRANYNFDVDVTDDTLGLERMLTIAVEAVKTQERADFSFLAQTALAPTRSVYEGDLSKGDPTLIEGNDVMAFMDAGFSAYKTRGATVAPQAPSARTSMQVFTLNIVKE